MGREKCSCWLGRDFFFLGSEDVLAYLGIRSMLRSSCGPRVPEHHKKL